MSNIKPAARPLRGSRILAPCPISMLPSEWIRVTALSRVLNKHAISITRATILINKGMLCLLTFIIFLSVFLFAIFIYIFIYIIVCIFCGHIVSSIFAGVIPAIPVKNMFISY